MHRKDDNLDSGDAGLTQQEVFSEDREADMLPYTVSHPTRDRLTKRERFVLAAMQGFAAAADNSDLQQRADFIAFMAVRTADATLAKLREG